MSELVAYNEIDPYAVEYMRWLMLGGLIAPGYIFTCSIEDLTPNDLRPFKQFHAFAGMGVWSYAARAAGVRDDRELWTGSCPCQPFSSAGKGGGFADERHLWPAFLHLIHALQPVRVVGEQVAGQDGLAWFDLVSSDLESHGYAGRAVPLCSAGFGSPDIRNRLYWVADAFRPGQRAFLGKRQLQERRNPSPGHVAPPGGSLRVAHSGVQQRSYASPVGGEARQEGGWVQDPSATAGCGDVGPPGPGPVNGFWGVADWLLRTDGLWTPVEPGTFPLDNGSSARVGRLSTAGNAINAQAATEFLRALMQEDLSHELHHPL